MSDELDPGEYDVCSYCNRSIFPDVLRCPHCGNYTDGKGAVAEAAHAPGWWEGRWMKVVLWLVLAGLLYPLTIAIYAWIKGR